VQLAPQLHDRRTKIGSGESAAGLGLGVPVELAPASRSGLTATRRDHRPRWTMVTGILSGVEALLLVLRYLHLIGFALLLGGAVVQYLSGTLRINQPMLWGAIAQLVTGIALSAPLRGDDPEPPTGKLVVKLVLAVLIFVMVFFSRKRAQVNRGHFLATTGLVLVAAAVGTFWR
jgi:hypothetical protein